MELVINHRTGLRETLHEYYRVPEVRQRNVASLRLNGQLRAVHIAPINNNLTLDFYSQLGSSQELFVVFHGANHPDNNNYPRFERVRSLKSVNGALVSFADPTLQLDRSVLLAWYLGGPGWDPLDDISLVIRKAMGKCGAKRVVFIGGSGGGYAALRASSRFPGSMAFVQSPQTRVGNYIPRVVSDYFKGIWPGWSKDDLLQAFPDRFDMVKHYKSTQPQNFVYYLQSANDESHMRLHYNPFKEAFGVVAPEGADRSGLKKFVLYDSELEGHGKPTAVEFETHLAAALTEYRALGL